MAGGRTLDRFEREAADFHARVRAAYLERASSEPQRIRVINANRSLEEIQQELVEILSAIL
jgi:dTMP kinase